MSHVILTTGISQVILFSHLLPRVGPSGSNWYLSLHGLKHTHFCQFDDLISDLPISSYIGAGRGSGGGVGGGGVGSLGGVAGLGGRGCLKHSFKIFLY